MVTFSVNEVVEHLDGLAGKDISVRGMLSFEFENVSLSHVPLFERAAGYASSVWLRVGDGSLGFDPEVCERLRGKVVIVEGKLLKPDLRFGGCGHLSLWPAEIVARTLELAPALK
jgi:hypothetical protein